MLRLQRAARGSPPPDLGGAGLPHDARAGLQGDGAPLDPGVAAPLGTRLGADFSGVRVHTDAAAAHAARALGARAYMLGDRIAFARGAYAPHDARGLQLLTHELAHVAQQARGDSSSEDVQEREADRTAAHGAPSLVSGGPPRPALRLRRGDIVRVTITITGETSALFMVELEDSDPVTSTGTVVGLEPGAYRLRAPPRGRAQMIITAADGSEVPQTSGFHATLDSRAVRDRLLHVTTAVPLIVRTAETSGAPGSGGEPGSVDETRSAQRREIDALPQAIRDFIFSATGPSLRPEDYDAVLRIAHAVRDLSAAELAEYRARTTGTTSDIRQFELGVDRWLAEVTSRRAAGVEEEAATRRLVGLESLWDLYGQWQRVTNTGPELYTTGIAPPSGDLARYEATPFAALRVPEDAYGWRLYYQFRAALDASGFANIGAYEAAVGRFIVAFRERAFYVGLEVLGRYEHILLEEQARYRDPAVSSALYDRLATARSSITEADELDRTRGRPAPFASADYMIRIAQQSARVRELTERAETQVSAQSTTDPLLANPDFPRADLARESRAGVGTRLQRYIAERLTDVRNTRRNLEADHELVFRLDQLVAATKLRADIAPGSMFEQMIAGHTAPRIDDIILAAAIAVFAIALGVVSAGTGTVAVLAAVGSFALSSVLAVQAYEDYAVRSDAYGAQLLSRRPWVGWVVISVLGAGLDLAMVGGALARLAPALEALEAGGSLATFRQAAQDVIENPRLRAAIIDGAEAQVRSRAAWEAVQNAPTLAPRGAMRGSLFGADIVFDAVAALPRTVYAVWLELQNGVRTFQRWILTREAVDLLGDVSQLSARQLEQARALYGQAVDTLTRLSAHGRSVGMTTDEIDTALRWWAQSGRGNADDLMRVMSNRSSITIGSEALALMQVEVDVARVRLVAATIDDTALRNALLSDGRVWRMLHNSDYDPSSLREAWAAYNRVRTPSQRLQSTSFGEYLANSAAYSTRIGAPTARPVVSVIAGWADMTMAQRARAIVETAEPRLAAALASEGAGLNAAARTEINALLQTDIVGRATTFEGARGNVMGAINEILGRTATSPAELRAALELTESSGSIGSIGEVFVGARLTSPAHVGADLVHPSFSPAELPGLTRASFEPDRIVRAAHETLDVKTGYAGGIDIADQAHNYERLMAASANPAVGSRVGGQLVGHSWLVLPGRDAATTSAQTVARRMYAQLEREGLLGSQRVFYLDDAGVIQRVTSATTQVPAGATIHAMLGLP